MREVKIYLVESPVTRSVKQIVMLSDAVKIVDNSAEADIIIAVDLKKIEKFLGFDAKLVLISVDRTRIQSTDKLEVVNITTAVVDLFNLIIRVREELETKDQEIISSEITEPVFRASEPIEGITRILVIDDTTANREAAKQQLANYSLTVVDGYESAMEIMSEQQFDVVLTDLYLPMSSRTLGAEAYRFGETVPYGFLLMLEAARTGARYVAIVTALNHHKDHFSAAFDHFQQFAIQIEAAKIALIHAQWSNGAKNWSDALDQVIYK